MTPTARRRSGSWAHVERGTAADRAASPRWVEEWPHAASTVRRGLPLLIAAAAAAAAVPTALAWTPGFSSTNTRAAIVASAVAALLAVSVVPLASRLGGVRAREPLLYVAALASASAAAIHFAAIKMHLEEDVLYAVFFVGSGIAQLVWPIWLLLRQWRPLLWLGALGNAAIVALWIADRAGAVPVGPDASRPPPFGFGDTVASGFELLLVAACLGVLVRDPGGRLRAAAGAALTLGVAALTALALLSVLGVGSSLLPPTK